MTDVELLEQIRKIIKDELQATNELEKQKVRNSPFKRAEQLLWNYELFEKIMKEKEVQKKEVLENGIPSKSKSILEYQEHGGVISDIVLEEETISEIIERLTSDIVWLQQAVSRIHLAIKAIESDENYPIFARYYFGGDTLDTIATDYCVDRKTIARRKNKLVQIMALHLFPKECLDELDYESEC